MALNGYGYPVNLERTPDAPLCADRNPWLDNDAAIYINQVGSLAPTGYFDGWWNTTDRQFEDPGPSAPAAIDGIRTANSHVHGGTSEEAGTGQNVVFGDGHVEFAKQPNVGINNDNIWGDWAQNAMNGQAAFLSTWNSFTQQEKNKNKQISTYSGNAVTPQIPGKVTPRAYDDALLVNEVN